MGKRVLVILFLGLVVTFGVSFKFTVKAAKEGFLLYLHQQERDFPSLEEGATQISSENYPVYYLSQQERDFSEGGERGFFKGTFGSSEIPSYIHQQEREFSSSGESFL